MTNYKCEVHGALPQGLAWSAGFKMTSTAVASVVASTLDTAWNTLWTDATGGLEKWVHSDVTTINTLVRQLDVNWRTVSKISTPRALAGTNVNTTANLASSPYLSFTGAQDTRSDRGRFKLPPFASDQIVAGLILNATCDAFAVVVSSFFSTMSGLSGAQIVSENEHTNKQGDAPHTVHVLTGGLFSNRPGTERARERKLKATHSATIVF